ncbi:hypothetical protein BGZ54_008921 [Gamsiella multidivaricata]|nr:hypothetical protein BGZ54_008921 [Gamsiella multidivaricata]
MIGSSSGAATTSSPAATVATTSTLKTHSTRGALKGPLPIDVQIELLSNVLKHDPFNCPIRRTTQVWERIAKEHGIRARTCARRYDNIIQASIAGRERPVGTEKQIETKKKLLEQLFVMMNQPQALLRMQKKRRYRSEEADRRLLLETIRLNPFAQKVGQVVKTWEDVRDAVGMKVHSRQCIRRVNRMIKPYQIRERMYKGNIPEEMREVNDELVKQVIQLMYLGGHAASLDEDGGQSNDEDSLSGVTDSEDQGDDYTVAGAQKRNSSQDSDELEENNDGDRTIPGKIGSLRATKQKFDVGMSMDTMDTTNSPSSSSFAATAQSPSTLSSTLSSTLAFSEPSSVPSSGHATPSRRNHLCNASYGSMDRKRSATETSAARTLEEEFRPQRIWGSHPYTKETLSRSTSGSHSRKSRSSARASSAEKRDDSYMQHATVRTELAQSPASDTSYRPSLSSPTSAMSSSMVAGQEYLGYMEGTQTPMSFEQTAQIYQTILSEFRVVKEYLVRMDDQRQRDKDNQKTMYRMIERLQYQMEGQQGMIQDLQNQMQHKGSQLPYRYDSSSPSLQYRDQSPSQQSQYLRGERSLPVAEPWGHEKLRVVGELSAQDRMPLVSMVLCEQQDQCNTEMASRYESKENEENNASVH